MRIGPRRTENERQRRSEEQQPNRVRLLCKVLDPRTPRARLSDRLVAVRQQTLLLRLALRVEQDEDLQCGRQGMRLMKNTSVPRKGLLSIDRYARPGLRYRI